jgi:hypothetical protein
MPRLEQWSVVSHPDDTYVAPECREPCLRGIVFDHPTHADGKIVLTTAIQGGYGQRVFTINHEYELGAPSPRYLRWMEEKGFAFDPENPIRSCNQRNKK